MPPGTVAALTAGFMLPVQAGRPFQARYEEVRVASLAGGAPEERRESGAIFVDSHGRTRLEMSSGGLTNILDPVSKMSYLIDTRTKEVFRVPFPEPPGAADPLPEQAGSAGSRTREAEDLGSRWIEGLPCHGVRIRREDITSEAWIAEPIGQVVRGIETSKGFEKEFRLFDIRLVEPPAELFEPSAGR
jgi:hypothetical protein